MRLAGAERGTGQCAAHVGCALWGCHRQPGGPAGGTAGKAVGGTPGCAEGAQDELVVAVVSLVDLAAAAAAGQLLSVEAHNAIIGVWDGLEPQKVEMLLPVFVSSSEKQAVLHFK